MSIRASHRNFANVKKECGIDESTEEDNALSTIAAVAPVVKRSRKALPALVEEPEEEGLEQREEEGEKRELKTKLRTTVLATLPATSKEASGMEKEVRQVLQPGSPISELLRFVLHFPRSGERNSHFALTTIPDPPENHSWSPRTPNRANSSKGNLPPSRKQGPLLLPLRIPFVPRLLRVLLRGVAVLRVRHS